MLLCERKTIPRGPGWHFEIKYDGYRLLAATGDAPRLKSRNGANATTWFPELVEALATLPAGSILDGEVCVLDDIGKSDFERLHARALRKLLGEPPPGLLYVDSVDDGAWLYGHALALGLEGLVGKRAGSIYQSGERSRDWQKIKRPGAVPAKRFRR
ncbi:hypothetical protein HTY52_12725 [Cupriavidus taiwanensis]|nr:hypothetical protein [Cupriavidus taiwanensis]